MECWIWYFEITRDSNVRMLISRITTISDKYKTAAAGGLVGACDSSSVSIENVNANNVTVTGNNVRDIGGLIAGNRKVTNINIDINVTVTSCVLHSIEVNNPIDSSEASTGGIIDIIIIHWLFLGKPWIVIQRLTDSNTQVVM